MVKTKKSQKKVLSFNYKKVLLIALVLVVSMMGLYYYQFFIKPTVAQAEISQMREMMLLSVEAVKKDAPVEAKTGDVYFPGARLFVPAPVSSLDVLTYSYDDDGTSQPDFSISNKRIFNLNASKVYAANNMNELLEQIPKLQACQRGISILYAQNDDDSLGDLKQMVDLSNGKKLYMYADSACPELNDVLPLLKQIKTY